MREFIASITAHSKSNRSSVPHYWICVYANDQWDLKLGRVNLGDTLDDAPFFLALNAAKGIIMFLERGAMALTRIWCIFELCETTKLGKPLEFWTAMGKIGSAGMSSGPTVVSLQNLDCSKAEVSYQTDKRRIFNHIAGVAEMDGLRMDENGKHQLQDVRGMRMDENGKHQLQDPCAEYEEELVVAHSHKFEQLNQTVQQAALRDITAQNDGLQTQDGSNRRSRQCTVSDETQRGLTLAQMREFWETVKADLAANVHMDSNVYMKTGACKTACVCKYGMCTCGQHGEPCTCRITAENVNNIHVSNLYVTPHTKPDQCSYFELMATGPQPPDFYPTTSVMTSFSDYISGIEWHAESRGLPDTTVYFDSTFARNKHQLDFTDAPANDARALRQCRGVVLVLPAPDFRRPDRPNECMTGQPLKRIWVVQELHEAVANNKLLDITTTGGALAGNGSFPDGSVEYGDIGPGLAWPLFEFDAADGAASTWGDIEQVLGEMGEAGITALNKKIRSLGIGPILRDAADCGDMEAVQKLSDMQGERGDTLNGSCTKLSDNAQPGSVGEYALHIAAAAGQSEMLQWLLEQKADPSIRDTSGATALEYAITTGKQQTILSHELLHGLLLGRTPKDVENEVQLRLNTKWLREHI